MTKKNHHLSKTIKKQSCSPLVKNSAVKGSCFSDRVLQELKLSFNKHADVPITATNPVQIWSELAEKTRQKYKCDKETCWVDHLADSTTKSKLKMLFSPPQPQEWKTNPVEWLTNHDILKVLKQYEMSYPEFFFIGPSMIDYDYKYKNGSCVCNNICRFDLKKVWGRGIRKIGIVFNLDTHDKSGSHWVSLFIDLEDQFIFYFNSTGEKIPSSILAFVKKVIKQGKTMNIPLSLHQNDKIEHQLKNTECGMYSLFFIITMLRREWNGKQLTKEDLWQLFRDGKRIKDEKMIELRNVFFNKD